LQTDVLRVLSVNRTEESFVAGGAALNRREHRFSEDIDIFQDRNDSLKAVYERDRASLEAAGFDLAPPAAQPEGKFVIGVKRDYEFTRLDYVVDTDFRFFPILPDPEFGFILHPVDLATNKASAAGARREPRDVIDLITIHERILPLGAVVAAAVGRFLGESPEGLLDSIRFNARLTPPDFASLSFDGPVDPAAIVQAMKAMFRSAEDYLAVLPSDEVGFVFIDADRAIQPEPGTWSRYLRHEGRRRGHWPSSPEIAQAMLRRYTEAAERA